MLQARRWWPAWLALHVLVLTVGLSQQLAVMTKPCNGCPTVIRLSASQRVAPEQAGGTAGQFRLVVALVVLAFAGGTYRLAVVLVRRSRTSGSRFRFVPPVAASPHLTAYEQRPLSEPAVELPV